MSSSALAAAMPEPDAGTEPPASGIEALCARVSHAVANRLQATTTVDLQIAAEGSAVDLAEGVRERCGNVVAAAGHRVDGVAHADNVVRLRLRTTGTSLVSLVEIGTASAPAALGTESISVPLGAALENWLSAGGTDIETWLVGSVDGRVLALCGAGSDREDVVGVVTADHVGFFRWTGSGLLPFASLDLPPALRARARAPAASANCRLASGGFTFSFGIHDRGAGGIVQVVGATATWVATLDGIPIGFDKDGGPMLAAGVEGTSLIRWHDRTYAQLVALDASASHAIGTTQDGMLLNGDLTTPAFFCGTGLAVADFDRTGGASLVLSRAVLPTSGAEDRLSVRPLGSPDAIRSESRPLKGIIGPLGTVLDAQGARVLAATWSGERSQIIAVGHRQAAR